MNGHSYTQLIKVIKCSLNGGQESADIILNGEMLKPVAKFQHLGLLTYEYIVGNWEAGFLWCPPPLKTSQPVRLSGFYVYRILRQVSYMLKWKKDFENIEVNLE